MTHPKSNSLQTEQKNKLRQTGGEEKPLETERGNGTKLCISSANEDKYKNTNYALFYNCDVDPDSQLAKTTAPSRQVAKMNNQTVAMTPCPLAGICALVSRRVALIPVPSPLGACLISLPNHHYLAYVRYSHA